MFYCVYGQMSEIKNYYIIIIIIKEHLKFIISWGGGGGSKYSPMKSQHLAVTIEINTFLG